MSSYDEGRGGALDASLSCYPREVSDEHAPAGGAQRMRRHGGHPMSPDG